MRRFVVLVGLMAGCRGEHKQPPPKTAPSKPASKIGTPVAPGTLKRDQVMTGYGVAVPADADLAALKKLAPDALVVKVTDFINEKQLEVATQALKPEDAEQLKAMTVLGLVGEGPDGVKLARDLATKAHELAETAHGWVLDPDALRAFRAEEFVKHIPGEHLDVRKLIMVHAVGGDNNELPFLDTAGLRRYGFPELYVAHVGASQVTDAMTLVNAVAQTLVEGGDVGSNGTITVEPKKFGWNVELLDGATGKATFTARWALEPDEHDENWAVVELVPAAGATPEGWAKTVHECFGSKPEQIVQLKDDDPELIAAANKTRAELVKLREHFKDGVPFKEHLTVKAKFTDARQVEWMWVDVVSFKGSTISGTLENKPDFVKNVRLGQRVSVQLADVADYLHELPDGTSVGAYSIDIMKKRGLIPSD